jgi:2-dehydro-3-deoxyglucarate aldolase
MKNKTLKRKLKKLENTLGTWVTIGNQAIVEVLAQAGQFDWLTIDLEHTVIDLNEMQILIGFIQSYDIAALVRVSKNDEVAIKHALDSGADGIIVPMISSAEDARRAVGYAKYPPLGIRGVGLNRAQKYGFGFDGYRKWMEESLVVIAQIEHIDAVNNIDEILSVEGIDGIFIGPYDLSCSLGVPGQFDSEIVIEALKTVEVAAKKHSVSLGYHIIEPDGSLIDKRYEMGYNFIAFATDFLFMGKKVTEELYKRIST